MKAIVIEGFGGPEVLQLQERETPAPDPGQVLVRQEAIGVNFIDVYRRTGLYAVDLPSVPGMEGAGTVEALGAGVRSLRPGDRVAYANVPETYAEAVLVPADRAVRLPARITFAQAAAAMLQGMTAHYLALDAYAVRKSDTVLVHAAAGGVGLLLVQVARMRGARIIATVSTPQKAELARGAGADEVILYTEKDFLAEVKRITGGRGVQAVYDSVGRTTFLKSLDCLAPRGMMVSFGQSSGKVEAVEPTLLSAKGSLFLTRPTLGHYIADSASLRRRAGEVLKWVATDRLS
ncbi:MAG: quinone oxidoreductase, partial [Spirochaetes bacterium]|nr:quinone oxidoreductase [Spirochaetota bacterium]